MRRRSFFTAGAKAMIELDFEYIVYKDIGKTFFTIYSESTFCLQSLYNMNIDHPFILGILCNYYKLLNKILKNQLVLNSEPHRYL